MALALGTRRSTLAAVASALTAMALAVAVAGRSCRVTTPGPEVAVRELLQAAKAGDRDAVYALLSSRTHARLVAEAARATELVGTTVRYADKDMISIGANEATPPPTDVTVLDDRNGRATVEVKFNADDRARFELVQEDGRWVVDVSAYSR